MATKLGRKEMPAGYKAEDFVYMGRPARDQGDFGNDVGLMEGACVNQFGSEADGTAKNNLKYFTAGVVQAKGRWFLYTEWGRIREGKSWQGGAFCGQDFQFMECTSEQEARKEFRDKCEEKNTDRLEQKNIGGKMIWASKLDSKGKSKDGYLIRRLASRSNGLPDAYGIKDSTGLSVTPKVSAPATPSPKSTGSVKVFQPQVIKLATDLTGGTVSFAKQRAKEAGGALPTMDAIQEVRDQYIPLVLQQLARVGTDIHQQIADSKLIDLSKLVWSLVPKVIPRSNDPFERAKAAILNADNLLGLQQDLDAYESALKAESFDLEVDETQSKSQQVDPDSMLNAKLTWMAPGTPEHTWVVNTFLGMSNKRHANFSRDPKIVNLFSVERPDRDQAFIASMKQIAAKRQGRVSIRANLQPKTRIDLGPHGDDYAKANVIFCQHGTRSVNVGPILQTTFRLPKSLVGVPIAGANFGHGTYASTDFRKAANYVSTDSGAYSYGAGGIKGRGALMFLCDLVMGDAYRAPSTGSWTSPPDGKDTVFGVGGDRQASHSLQNDEHVSFSPSYYRIRYLLELTF